MKMHCVYKETCMGIGLSVYAYDHYLLNFILFSDFSPCMGMGLRANFLDSDVNPYYHVSIRLDPKALPK